jgi:hypothetical protein
MAFLTEDATYLAGGLAILAAVFLIALRVSQQGKFLVWAVTALGLAGLVVVFEWLWVTDNERIEQVVYDLRRAVAASDAPGVLAHLTPDVQYGQRTHYSQPSAAISGDAARAFIESELERVRFEFIRVVRLEANAGRQSGRGTALFRIQAAGSYQSPMGPFNFAGTNLDFSLGFRNTAPGIWKVDRINLTQAPREMHLPGSVRLRRR